jgi:hypothetical protein
MAATIKNTEIGQDALWGKHRCDHRSEPADDVKQLNTGMRTLGSKLFENRLHCELGL